MIIGIACINNNRGLGKDNKLLYHLKEDMKFFRNKTKNHAVVSGYNTWESIGCKPLPNRKHLILTSKDLKYDDAMVFHAFDKLLKKVEWYSRLGIDVYIIGGASIYEQFMPYYDKILITHVDDNAEADAFFPEIDENQFTMTEQSDIINEGEYKYVFQTYERKYYES